MENLILNQNYGMLYEEVYKGKCMIFEFKNSLGSVKHLFMKRKVPYQVEGITYYDLITPFNYGGPVIEGCKEEDKWDLINDFQIEFQKYCQENNIVSEFIRFHPLLQNSMDFLHCYELDYLEDSKGINISRHNNTLTEELSVDCIEKVLEAFKSGVDYEIFTGKDTIDDFSRFITKVQGSKENQSPQYFEGCKELLDDQLIFIEVKLEGEVVGMAMNIRTDKVLTTHLLVTDKIGDSLNAAYVLHFALAVWSRSNEVELIHLAGNWINKSEKENATFKNNFRVFTDYQYCIGRKIWNEEIYEELCDRAKVERYIDYFPAYRVREKKLEDFLPMI
ncbi:hypothetical protein [Planococcus halotolerans]|uniref:hypothetical protein n=1 Tax=Planococcus halotolerans TaxID=2233542 RepID=UPI0010927A13|nr:hypothetical protein [Planococcus halotolerans]QHJ70560.1 hypothetical protein DNR44_008050 [Planococcus halotolerans]